MLRSTRSDALAFMVTFFSGLLFPLHIAIYLGAGTSIVLFLKKVSEPKLVEYAFDETGETMERKVDDDEEVPAISIVHVEGELFFASTEIFLDQIRFICESPHLKVIVLKIRNANSIDATSALTICDLIKFAHERGIGFVISGANRQVEGVLKESGAMALLGKENFFRFDATSPNACTRKALKRAQEFVGKKEAQVILFTAPDLSGEKESKDEAGSSTSHKTSE